MNFDPDDLTPRTLLRQKPDLLSSSLDQDLVLMSLENDKYYGMDSLSRHVWELLAEPRSVGDVCALLRADYDVSPEQCERDLLAFARRLTEARLVEIVDR
jgi:hypothetical protein